MQRLRWLGSAAGFWAAAALLCSPSVKLSAQADLDAFMQQALAQRDDNWTKLQRYILDEREVVEVRGASDAPFWGEQRDYTWFMKDGFFVRSPVKVNGVTIPEPERRKYEAAFLQAAQQRERRSSQAGAGEAEAPRDLDGLILQTREPRFVSSAYFLRFRFDQGTYALVGHEPLEGRDALRIEYYPSNLFPQGRRGPGRLGSNPVDAETRRLLNKVAIVTLWIDASSHQILKYTFDNVDLDFLPAQWLVRVKTARASMTMGQAFPDVWLPRDVDFHAGLTLAVGDFSVHYQLAYHDYRRADTTSTLHVPPAP